MKLTMEFVSATTGSHIKFRGPGPREDIALERFPAIQLSSVLPLPALPIVRRSDPDITIDL